jgi:hypothetical protein
MGSEVSDYYTPEEATPRPPHGESLAEDPGRQIAGLAKLTKKLVQAGELLEHRYGQQRDLLGLSRKLAGVGDEVPHHLRRQAAHRDALAETMPRTEEEIDRTGVLPPRATIFVRRPRRDTGR